LPVLVVVITADDRFAGTMPCSLSSAGNLAVVRLNGNSGLYGTLPEQLVQLPHLVLLDARGTGMQQPKYVTAATNNSMGGRQLTAVPSWMEVSR
jgi:hypothetical protein